jgi:hypothetical protein
VFSLAMGMAFLTERSCFAAHTDPVGTLFGAIRTAGQFHRLTQRLPGDSGDFVYRARATGLACSHRTGLADT